MTRDSLLVGTGGRSARSTLALLVEVHVPHAVWGHHHHITIITLRHSITAVAVMLCQCMCQATAACCGGGRAFRLEYKIKDVPSFWNETSLHACSLRLVYFLRNACNCSNTSSVG